MSAIPNLTQPKELSNKPTPPTMAELMTAHFRRAFISDPPKPKQPNIVTRILKRLGLNQRTRK